MTAARYDFELEQGADFTDVWTWRDDAGILVNLTGYTARMHVRDDPESLLPLLDANTTNGRIVLGGALGTITFAIPAAILAAVTAGNYFYDLELISGGGIVTRLLGGKVAVTREITR